MTQVNDNIKPNKRKNLTYEERLKIEAYKELGYLKRKIAYILGRAPQTINDAINQGTVRTIKQRQVLDLSIKNCLKKVDTKEHFGHWKIDRSIGSQAKEGPVLLTLAKQ